MDVYLGDTNDPLAPEKVSAVNERLIPDNIMGLLLLADLTEVTGEKMVMVACGWRHTISVSASGALYTFGWSKYGQLGHGDFEDHLVPRKLEVLQGGVISQVSGGWRHTMALTSDGKLYGWGWNKFGQVGVGDNIDHYAPVQINFPIDQKVVQVSCGWRHSLANKTKYSPGVGILMGSLASVDRNVPEIIEALSVDDPGGQQMQSSNVDAPGKIWVSPSERHAIIPDETVSHYFYIGQNI